jgi:hypothetical protein
LFSKFMITEQITIRPAEPIVNGHPATSRRGARVVAHPKFPYAVVIPAAIVAPGLLLLNDGIYWDGWPMYMMPRDGNREDLLRYFVEAGLPMRAYMHYAIGSFPGIVFGYKLVSFLAIAVSSLVIYRICDESGSLRRWESLPAAIYPSPFPHPRIDGSVPPHDHRCRGAAASDVRREALPLRGIAGSVHPPRNRSICTLPVHSHCQFSPL